MRLMNAHHYTNHNAVVEGCTLMVDGLPVGNSALQSDYFVVSISTKERLQLTIAGYEPVYGIMYVLKEETIQ